MAIAYSLATLEGAFLKKQGVASYLGRCYQEKHRRYSRQSDFALGLARYGWQQTMEQCSILAQELIALKPHKRRYFEKGFSALSFMQSVF